MRLHLPVFIIPAFFLGLAGSGHGTGSLPHFDGQNWWRHIEILADDNMEGRDTGSPGLERAQTYVVSQLKAAKLKPAGTNGFYQRMAMVSRQVDESASNAALVVSGKVKPLTLGKEGFFSSRIDLAPSIEAPMVFVGYGLQIPEKQYDDYAGLDLHGKIAVSISGAPADLPSELAAHSRSTDVRWKALKAAGAIGVITILNPTSMDIPWSRISANRNHPSMSLVGAEFEEMQGAQVAFAINPEYGSLLFEGSGHTFDQVIAVLKSHKQLPRFPLSARFRAKTKMIDKNIESANLVAELPGSDAKLKSEYVVLSAHLDHVGIGEPINGDRIYNGAMDNGSGSAALIDIAAALEKNGTKPKRSLLFVFVTGEEKGELGSEYFAAKPTVPQQAIVADVNVDMFLPLVPLKTLNVYGLKESTLGDTLAETAKAAGLTVRRDPEPQRSIFTRSDQYSFVKKGIPSIMYDVAFLGADQEKIVENWLHNRYHAPSDDLKQPVNKESAGKFEDVTAAYIMAIADAPQKPMWKQDSFFRRFARGGSQSQGGGLKSGGSESTNQ